MSGYVLAIDQGTTSTRAIVFDHRMKVAGVGQKEFPQLYPQSGWVEHDPEDIWQSVLSTVRKAIKAAGIEAKDIASVGITNQRETVVVWERESGKPIQNAIVWQDRRTAETAGPRKTVHTPHRPSARSLFFRHQAFVDARQC
jgi:glycerol kinase